MTSPTDFPQFAQLDQASHELREGLETSREMVRQTRTLIEFAECDGAPAANDNNTGFSD